MLGTVKWNSIMTGGTQKWAILFDFDSYMAVCKLVDAELVKTLRIMGVRGVFGRFLDAGR